MEDDGPDDNHALLLCMSDKIVFVYFDLSMFDLNLFVFASLPTGMERVVWRMTMMMMCCLIFAC